jgi:hypothetical protein
MIARGHVLAAELSHTLDEFKLGVPQTHYKTVFSVLDVDEIKEAECFRDGRLRAQSLKLLCTHRVFESQEGHQRIRREFFAADRL